MLRSSVFGLFLCASIWAQSTSQQPAANQQPTAPPQPTANQQAPGTPQSGQRPPIRVQVNEVIVPITVTDDKGRFVSNLEKSDFKIFDSGKEQNISFFTRERNQPVVVGFLLDLSNASKIHWKNYQEAATE